MRKPNPTKDAAQNETIGANLRFIVSLLWSKAVQSFLREMKPQAYETFASKPASQNSR